jgi:hypothetical protein
MNEGSHRESCGPFEERETGATRKVGNRARSETALTRGFGGPDQTLFELDSREET